MELKQGIYQKLVTAFPDAAVEVAEDRPEHFEVRIISDSFEGQSPVNRHRMVYAALGNAVGREIHALSLKTQTRTEAAA